MNNFTIRKVSKSEKSVINDIVNIHLATFNGFFLTFMGRGFLRQMYLSYTQHKESDIYIATENGTAIGFLAYSTCMSGLYKYMIKHHLMQFAWYSLGALFRKPEVFIRLIRAFSKPRESKRNERYVELASIGVHPDAKAKGIGSRLIDALKSDIDFAEFEYITLETDAVDNEIANKFYTKNGFHVVREYKTHEGRRMYEYRYEGGRSIGKTEASLHTEYS